MEEIRYPEDYNSPCDSDKDYPKNNFHCTNPECGKIKIWADCVEIDIDCFR